MEKLLVINPGSTSTKIAYFEGNERIWQEDISHSRAELERFDDVLDQLEMRCALVKDAMAAHGVRAEELTALAARGGTIAPLRSGAYEVNDAMVDVILHRPQDRHASLLGALIARRIAGGAGLKAYIYDAVTVDELDDICHITGLPFIRRVGQGHQLNMRAAALKYCADSGQDYAKSTLLVAHLGGGITVSLHIDGRVADMSNDEDGPFAPERAGCLPATPFMDLCFGGEYSKKDVVRLLKGKGGLVAWLGTGDTREVERRIAQGDEKARLIYDAMALGVAKALAKLTPLCRGKVDQIILTGGIAYSEMFTEMIRSRVDWIAPVTVIPGENEMQALADGVLRVLRGEETARLMEK